MLGVTDLTNTIHERVLIKNIHWRSLKERACSLDPDMRPFHLLAGFFNHFNPLPHIAPKGNVGPVHKRTILVHPGIKCIPMSGRETLVLRHVL